MLLIICITLVSKINYTVKKNSAMDSLHNFPSRPENYLYVPCLVHHINMQWKQLKLSRHNLSVGLCNCFCDDCLQTNLLYDRRNNQYFCLWKFESNVIPCSK